MLEKIHLLCSHDRIITVASLRKALEQAEETLSVGLSLEGYKGYSLKVICELTGQNQGTKLQERVLVLGGDTLAMILEAEEAIRNAERKV